MTPQEFGEAWRALFPPAVLAHVERQKRLAQVRARGFVEGGLPPDPARPPAAQSERAAPRVDGPPGRDAFKAEIMADVVELLKLTVGARVNGTPRDR